MKIKTFFNYYRATFPGEILEKGKRNFLILINKFGNKEKKECEAEISTIFFNNHKKVISSFEIKDVKFEFFNKKLNLLENIDWGIQSKDREKSWFKIKISDYKDIKYNWEINRLQFLLPLILNGQEERALFLLDDWIKENKFDKGPNWFSNLEVAIRSISIINALVALNSKEIAQKYTKLIYEHGVHIYEDIEYTEKCIPNNHLVGEAAALYCISKFLKSDLSLKWEKKSKSILKTYINHIRKDGTYIEGSLSYHRFFLQMYIMVFIFSEKTNDNFLNKEITNILEKSYIFFKSIEKPDRTYPDFGDNDEGYFYKVYYKSSFFDFVESISSFFYSENSFKNEIRELSEKVYKIQIKKEILNSKIKDIFEIGKYIVLKKNNSYIFFNNQEQIYHSHSDGLSIELMINGVNILSDSGTFSYNLNKEKRSYYRGTSSHNTIKLDKIDQSLQVGSFRWLDTPKNKINIIKKDEILIEISGEIITKLNKKHVRKISLEKDFKKIEILDIVENVKELELNWHFHKEVNLKKITNKRYKILETGYLLEIQTDFLEEIEMKESFCSDSYGVEYLRKKILIKNKENNKNYQIKTIIKKEEEK